MTHNPALLDALPDEAVPAVQPASDDAQELRRKEAAAKQFRAELAKKHDVPRNETVRSRGGGTKRHERRSCGESGSDDGDEDGEHGVSPPAPIHVRAAEE